MEQSKNLYRVIHVFLHLFWLNVYFCLVFQIVNLVPVSFPSLWVLCMFFFISLCIAFTSSFILQTYSIISLSILITIALNTASDRLAISLSLSSFSGVLICSFTWAIFLCLRAPVSCKGWTLRYSPGWGTPLCGVVALSVGEGSEREHCWLLGSHLSFSHSPLYSQVNCALLVKITG